MDLTVCICTHDRPRYVRDCLAGLRRQTVAGDRFGVLIVDSGSPEPACRELRDLARLHPGARLIRVDEPGVSAARNAGAAAATTAYIAYIDDDAVPADNWVAAILAALAGLRGRPVVLGGRILPRWEAPLPAWWPPSLRGLLSIIEHEGMGEYRTAELPPGLEPYGCNMVVQVASLLAAGGFGCGIGRIGGVLLSDEDVQLAWRLQDAGQSARYDSRIVVFHQIQAKRLNPAWMLSRLYWQGASTVLTRRLLHDGGSVWRELPRRLLVAVLFAPAALWPTASTEAPRGPLAPGLRRRVRPCRAWLARDRRGPPHRPAHTSSPLGHRWTASVFQARGQVILYQWRGAHRNFGDELNSVLWPRLLPDFFDQDADTRFLGIGSILDNRHDFDVKKLVAGSGYGGYQPRIALDESWIVHWVRGQRTARLLGLPPAAGIGDPASLLPLAGLMPERENGDIGFMPHFESAVRGAWQEVSAIAGVTLIDPRDDPMEVIAAIGKCRVMISEALHGIIVADALRVPWIAIQPLAPIHRPKWVDWAETLDLAIEFHALPPSTALEQAHLTHLSRFHMGRHVLSRHSAWLRGIARERYIERAARTLRAITLAEPAIVPGHAAR